MKAGQEPAARGCRVGVLDGGDTGEFFPGNGRGSSSTATFWGGVERGSWCGWGRM